MRAPPVHLLRDAPKKLVFCDHIILLQEMHQRGFVARGTGEHTAGGGAGVAGTWQRVGERVGTEPEEAPRVAGERHRNVPDGTFQELLASGPGRLAR